jgi:Na+/H+ antiporter NhaD/arsenite permease-like protein
MIIGHMSRLSFVEFSWSLVPVASAGLVIEYLLLSIGFRRMLATAAIRRTGPASKHLDPRLILLACGVLVLVFAGFVVGLNLAWTALSGGALMMVLARRDTHEVFRLVDWHLLVFFAALFIVVEGLNGTGLPDQAYQRVRVLFGHSTASQAWNLAWFSIVGSNIFSNVPFVLVAGKWIANFAEPQLMWKVMALTTTFAGNLTILGSVANVIVVETARKHVELGFWDYARFGIPVTVATTVVGVTILLLIR